jgi:glyoxylase-like metal-dependent hydrolase (beta-lactamase superfamily II)
MGSTRVSIGDVEVIALSDGQDRIASPARYFPGVPDAAWEPYRRLYPDLFASPTAFNWHFFCYLLRSRGKTLLVDAGIGPGDTPESIHHNTSGRLPAAMAAVGVRPRDIDVVILTHLHGDHVGWCVSDHSGTRGPTFDHARYVAHEADWNAFASPVDPRVSGYAYVHDLLRPLATEGQLDLVSGEGRTLTADVDLVHCPGHTPGSMAVAITSAGAAGLLWGDAIAHPAQLDEPEWDYLFDVDKPMARQSRARLVQRLDGPGAIIGAGHFGLRRLVVGDGMQRWRPVRASG